MVDQQVLAFVAIATVVTITPGVDMALVLRNTMVYGRGGASPTILGICSGLLVHATLSAVGLSAILARSDEAFQLVKLAGAVYLAFLGVQTLWRQRGGTSVELEARARSTVRRSVTRAFWEGLLNNLLNPKVALFYLTFLPQFISPGDAALHKSLLLAGLHLSIGLAWLFLYAYLVERLGVLLTRADVRRRLEQATGFVLVGLGVRLAFERR